MSLNGEEERLTGDGGTWSRPRFFWIGCIVEVFELCRRRGRDSTESLVTSINNVEEFQESQRTLSILQQSPINTHNNMAEVEPYVYSKYTNV